MTPALWKGLDEALAHGGGTHTIGDLMVALDSDAAQLHEAENAAIVTELVDYPRMRVCNFWLAAGEMDAVIELSHTVLRWAGERGCRRATFTGRRGWERVLMAEGWSRELTQMGREVRHGQE